MSVAADPLDLHYKFWSEVKLLAGLFRSGTSQMNQCVGRIVRCVSTAGLDWNTSKLRYRSLTNRSSQSLSLLYSSDSVSLISVCIARP